MKKRILFSLLAVFSIIGTAKAQEETILSAQIYGYKDDMVYFDCVQTPNIRQEFYTNPGEEHLYGFNTDQFVCMLINGKIKVLLEPGDSIHVDVHYNNKQYDVTFSGDENAVKNNKVLQDIDMLKRDMRYKSQLLGCVALDIKPKDRIADSRILLEKATTIIEEAQMQGDAKNYILSQIEAEVYMSFVEYPVMYESVRKVAINEQEIGDYWNITDGYTTRNDAPSLSNPEYVGFLMRYCFYMNEKNAKANNSTYNTPTRFEDMYKDLAEFYSAEQRDCVLYFLLRNFIMNGQEVERADALYKEYKEKYNKEKKYIEILDSILQ